MLEESVNSIISQLKRKCRVDTFARYDDARLREDIVPDAAASLAGDLGMTTEEAATFDWSEPSRERTLLVNLCFYEFNDAAEQFGTDFADEIAKCRDARLAAQHAAEAADEN